MPAPRVLIADDQPEVLRALSFICSAEGYQAITVNSPSAVLAKLGKEDFDLVLIDLNYRQDIETGKEGLELLKQIRGIDSYLLSALRRLGVEISADIHFLLASSKGTR